MPAIVWWQIKFKAVLRIVINKRSPIQLVWLFLENESNHPDKINRLGKSDTTNNYIELDEKTINFCLH